jgi:hypothetical protein
VSNISINIVETCPASNPFSFILSLYSEFFSAMYKMVKDSKNQPLDRFRLVPGSYLVRVKIGMFLHGLTG